MIDTSNTMALAEKVKGESTWQKESRLRKEAIQVFMNEQSIELSSAFVPFSQSRNAKEGARECDKNLNWKVTVTKNNRVILTTDYMAGIAHCPSYKQGARWTLAYSALIDFECETGNTAKGAPWGITKGAPIKPDYIDVLYSLISDSNVLDYASFEQWAREYDYDTDSRKAESVYRACLEIALALRNGLGESTMARLVELFQDY